MSHTKEPMFQHNFNQLARYENGRTPVLLTEEQYRRARACVNAFAGSPTDAIEEISATGRSVAQLCAMYAKAKERRDELLSALETVNESAVCFAKNEYSISTDAISKVENAIARAKGPAS